MAPTVLKATPALEAFASPLCPAKGIELMFMARLKFEMSD
jgi:hypothetical protein